MTDIIKNLKVVEFASVLAGPAVGMFFAELGAEVIKIENKTTGGDVTRSWKLSVEDQDSTISAYWCSVNWGKKHEFLDLNNKEDQAYASQLALQADLVISNFKPSFAHRVGLSAAILCYENPRLIYAQLSSYADPEDESPAFDMVLQAEAGFLYMCGEADRPPVRMPVALIDVMAAHQLKEAILLALLQREKTGRGCIVSTSLMEAALASLMNQASNYLMTGLIPQRMGTRHPNIAPYGDVYTCADGQALLLAIGTERQFVQFCHIADLEHLLQDTDFQKNAERVKNRSALNNHIAKVIQSQSLEYWIVQCRDAGVPAARIRDMKAVFDRPEANDMILVEPGPKGEETKRLRTIAFKLIEPD